MGIPSNISLRLLIGFIKFRINHLIKVLDMNSLFANVSLSKTNNNIKDRANKGTVIDANLKKNTLKK